MAFVGNRLEINGSANVITSSNSSNLILSSSTLISTGAMKLSGSLVIEQTGADYFTLNTRNGPGSLSIYGKATSANYADLYIGNVVTVNPLWTFSVRSDSSFLYFGYNGASFTNSMRLGMGGGTCIGNLAASVQPVVGVTHISEQVSIGGSGFNAPTARLHTAGGTTTVSPIRINSGSLLDTPTTGSIEYDATNFYGTTAGPTRRAFAFTSGSQINASAVTSSFMVSTASNMTLRVPGGGGETARAFVMTRNGTPVPTFGSDAFLFVTGTAFAKDDASDRGVAVFAGDVVMSGNLWGGYQTFGGVNTTRLGLKGGQIILGGGEAFSMGAPTPENAPDVAVFISGSIGSKDGSSRGVTIIGGDAVISGSLFLEKAIDPTVVNPTSNSIGAIPNSTGFITSSLSLGNIFRVTLNNNTGSFLAPTNARDGQQATWIVKQSTFGNGIGVWASGTGGFAWPGGVAPTLSTSASAIDMVSAQYDGNANRWLATFAKGFV